MLSDVLIWIFISTVTTVVMVRFLKFFKEEPPREVIETHCFKCSNTFTGFYSCGFINCPLNGMIKTNKDELPKEEKAFKDESYLPGT